MKMQSFFRLRAVRTTLLTVGAALFVAALAITPMHAQDTPPPAGSWIA
jgi:hypothetical protein